MSTEQTDHTKRRWVKIRDLEVGMLLQGQPITGIALMRSGALHVQWRGKWALMGPLGDALVTEPGEENG